MSSGRPGWTVVVTNSAPARMPTPARGRVEGDGGYGLYLVTDLTGSRGVHHEPDRELVRAWLAKPGAIS